MTRPLESNGRFFEYINEGSVYQAFHVFVF